MRQGHANVLNKQSRTADKGQSCSLGFGRGANNPRPRKSACDGMLHKVSVFDGLFGSTS